MLFQLTDLTTNETRGYIAAYQIRDAVLQLTNDVSEAESVFEWAINPIIGGWQYDGPSFTVRILD